MIKQVKEFFNPSKRLTKKELKNNPSNLRGGIQSIKDYKKKQKKRLEEINK